MCCVSLKRRASSFADGSSVLDQGCDCRFFDNAFLSTAPQSITGRKHILEVQCPFAWSLLIFFSADVHLLVRVRCVRFDLHLVSPNRI